MRKEKVRRVGAFPSRQDTPLKRTLNRPDKGRKLLPSKLYEALPEHPEEEKKAPTVLMSIKPVCCKSASGSYKESEHRLSPSGHPAVHVTPEPQIAVKGKEPNLSVTSESITSSTGSTFSYDDDDDDDCCPSSSATSSSLPSPEVFRKVETLSLKDELLGLHSNVKNSTLLDVSYAETIHMYQPPNLSNIFDASTILVEENCEIRKNGPEAETKIKKDSFKSEWKIPTMLTNRKPISYKKKVWFKSPVIAETFAASKLTIHKASESAHTLSPAEQIRSDTEASRAAEINLREKVTPPTGPLRKIIKSSPGKAIFFDFFGDNDRDVFFRRMRERAVKLRSAPLFPLMIPE